MKASATLLFGILLSWSPFLHAETAWWKTLNSKYQLELNKQSYCYRADNGNIVGELVDEKRRPASVTKLYVSLWGLDKLSKNHRFQTQFFYHEGKLHIKGGEDPFFISESIFYLQHKLKEKGIQNIREISFDSSFFFNWSDDRYDIASSLIKFFNADQWNTQIKTEFRNTKAQITKLGLPLILNYPYFNLQKATLLQTPPQWVTSATLRLTHSSTPLHAQLKQMNIYSTNFYAEKLFQYLGGVSAFKQYLLEEFNVDENTAYFYTGSGLGENYTTCELTLNVIERLKEIISRENLTPQDIISVAGVDLGTLRNRFTVAPYKGAVMAKTGTLRHTITLAGILSAANEDYNFVIFNHSYASESTRNFQNKAVEFMFKELGGTNAISYQAPFFSVLKDSVIK